MMVFLLQAPWPLGCTALWHVSKLRKWTRFDTSTSVEDLGDHETLFWTAIFVFVVASGRRVVTMIIVVVAAVCV